MSNIYHFKNYRKDNRKNNISIENKNELNDDVVNGVVVVLVFTLGLIVGSFLKDK